MPCFEAEQCSCSRGMLVCELSLHYLSSVLLARPDLMDWDCVTETPLSLMTSQASENTCKQIRNSGYLIVLTPSHMTSNYCHMVITNEAALYQEGSMSMSVPSGCSDICMQ